MPWFKLDDCADQSRKVAALSPFARDVWIRCGLWCSRALSDGQIPKSEVYMLAAAGMQWGADPRAVVDELLRVPDDHEHGLLEDRGDPLYFWLHDYLDYNPPRAKVLKERAKAKERKSRWKERQENARRNAVPNGGKNGGGTLPPKPDPVPDPVPPNTGVCDTHDFDPALSWLMDNTGLLLGSEDDTSKAERAVNAWREKHGDDLDQIIRDTADRLKGQGEDIGQRPRSWWNFYARCVQKWKPGKSADKPTHPNPMDF